MEQLAKTKTK